MAEKEAIIRILIFIILAFVFMSAVAVAEEQLIMKFHSEGNGKNVSVNLRKFFPESKDFFYSRVANVTIEIDDGIATITPNIGWKGDELIIFSPNESLVGWTEGSKENLSITNIEPVIEMSFPDVKNFGATPGQMEFSVAVFDPDNDFLDIEWLVNGVSVKKEQARGGTVSRFIFNETEYLSKGSVLRDYKFNENATYYVVDVVINDSKNTKTNEWHFNVVNRSCTDMWECSNWSDCIDGKRQRDCVKTNPQCALNFNKPSTGWIDPNCAVKTVCSPNWSCGEWEKCTINYNTGIIQKGALADAISTKQQRICYDPTYCIGSIGIEVRECNESIPIKTRQVDWCFDKYIEIYNADNGFLISRIRQSKLGNQGLDIEISLKDLASMKYCWYCFNGIKDYDETGVDCGGSCEDCVAHNVSVSYNILDYKTAIFLVIDVILFIVLFKFIKMR